MGDMAEHFADYKAIKSREKSQRSEANIRWLKEREI